MCMLDVCVRVLMQCAGWDRHAVKERGLQDLSELGDN